MAAIAAEALVKVFPSSSGEVRALDGVYLEVPVGSVLGLLGPNGARAWASWTSACAGRRWTFMPLGVSRYRRAASR
jgi:ABC-type lipopolysaccharide export system ATPase subunit